MKSEAPTVDQYLEEVPEKRVQALRKLRDLCLTCLPNHRETMAYGMPSYERNEQVEVALASQKQYICLYILKHHVVLENEDRLRGINHGKGCLRYTNSDTIDYDLIADLLKQTHLSDGPIC